MFILFRPSRIRPILCLMSDFFSGTFRPSLSAKSRPVSSKLKPSAITSPLTYVRAYTRSDRCVARLHNTVTFQMLQGKECGDNNGDGGESGCPSDVMKIHGRDNVRGLKLFLVVGV